MKIVMNTGGIKLRKIRNQRLRILGPKNDDFGFFKRNKDRFLVERIEPLHVASAAVESCCAPLRKEAGMSVERLAEMMTGAIAFTVVTLSVRISTFSEGILSVLFRLFKRVR